MGHCAIASAESIRLPVGTNGDFITVKAELTAGEALDLADVPGDKTLAAIIAYLEGWSLVGIGDQPVPYSPQQSIAERRDTLRALKVSVLRAIVAALEPHVTAQQQAVEEKKTTPPSEAAS
jgi:hypothetical protein